MANYPKFDRRTALGAALALGTVASSFAPRALAARRDPILQTRAGRVRGRHRDGIDVYLGVRYGADTSSARFAPPAAPQPWRGTLDASTYGPASPQRGDESAQSEDCLFLNIWTPAVWQPTALPIMVYIHGGAYATGSGSSPLYDGATLCARGNVVVITLNHRLNAFGYAYLSQLTTDPRLQDGGNAGTLDLVLALQWIRDHAERLGGDPNRIMLFGQSGGGAKIATLMATPAAAGLFHRAATMSGQQVTASGPLNATRRTGALLAALGLSTTQAAELTRVPAARIVEALGAPDPILGRGTVYFGPVLDERTLLRHPFYPDAPAQSASIPMIIGNTRDETRSLIGRADASTFSLEWPDLPARLAAEMRVDIDPASVIAAYRELYPNYSPSDVFFAATTASRSWRGAVIEAELRAAQGAPTWVYQLDYRSPLDGGRWGAHHTLDIPLVFGTLDAVGSATGTSIAARSTSNAMLRAFVALAHTGDPNHPLLPTWERYSLEQRATMIFDSAPQLAFDPRGAERRLFAKVPFTQAGT
jgi:para-nitrobenzyl esterase